MIRAVFVFGPAGSSRSFGASHARRNGTYLSFCNRSFCRDCGDRVAPGQGAGTTGWSVGVRGEYVALGGDPFATFAGGYGSGAFIRHQLGDLIRLELGGRVSRHRQSILCFSDNCVPYVHRNFTEVYIRPLIQPTLPGTALVSYIGVQLGLIAGPFQDGSPGLSTSAVGGFTIPSSYRLAADVGLTGTMVYVGTDRPRSAWGQRWGLQLGLSVR